MYLDAFFATVLEIYVICSDGRRGNHVHRSSVKECSIALCSCTDNHRIRIHQYLSADLLSIEIDYIRIRLEHAFKERDILICNNFHFNINVLTACPPSCSEVKRLSAARNSFIFFSSTSR